MANLTKGLTREPLVIVAYGVPGIGKSTFASYAERALFIGPERNGTIDAYKLDPTKSGAELTTQINEVLKGVYDGRYGESADGKKDGQNFKTLVIDSIDMVARDLEADLLKENPGKNMNTVLGGFGKGYLEIYKRLFDLRTLLNRVRDEKKMDIVILGHSIVNKFADPLLGIDYDVFELALHKAKRNDFNSIFTDWADAILFLNWRTVKTADGDRAVSMGDREILTEQRASHLAKNRFNLPFSIPLNLGTFREIYAMIDQFYASGATANTADNEFNILVADVKEKMTDKKVEAVFDKVKETVETAINTHNLELLTNVRQRLIQLINN